MLRRLGVKGCFEVSWIARRFKDGCKHLWFPLAVLLFSTSVAGVEDLFAIQGNAYSGGVALTTGNTSFKLSFDACNTAFYDSGNDFNDSISSGQFDVMLGNASLTVLQFDPTERYVWLQEYVNGAVQNWVSVGGSCLPFSNPFYMNNATIDQRIDVFNATLPAFHDYTADGIYVYLDGVTFKFNQTAENATITLIASLYNETSLINALNSSLDSRFLNLSGSNANQNINVSPYRLQTGGLMVTEDTVNSTLTANDSGVIINEGQDVGDFRIATKLNTHMFVVNSTRDTVYMGHNSSDFPYGNFYFSNNPAYAGGYDQEIIMFYGAAAYNWNTALWIGSEHVTNLLSTADSCVGIGNKCSLIGVGDQLVFEANNGSIAYWIFETRLPKRALRPMFNATSDIGLAPGYYVNDVYAKKYYGDNFYGAYNWVENSSYMDFNGTSLYFDADSHNNTYYTQWSNDSVAGSNEFVQYNDNGVFGGDANFTWNRTDNRLTIVSNGTHGTNLVVNGSLGQTWFTGNDIKFTRPQTNYIRAMNAIGALSLGAGGVANGIYMAYSTLGNTIYTTSIGVGIKRTNPRVALDVTGAINASKNVTALEYCFHTGNCFNASNLTGSAGAVVVPHSVQYDRVQPSRASHLWGQVEIANLTGTFVKTHVNGLNVPRNLNISLVNIDLGFGVWYEFNVTGINQDGEDIYDYYSGGLGASGRVDYTTDNAYAIAYNFTFNMSTNGGLFPAVLVDVGTGEWIGLPNFPLTSVYKVVADGLYPEEVILTNLTAGTVYLNNTIVNGSRTYWYTS